MDSSSMGKMSRKLSLAMVVVAALVLAMGMPGQASAADLRGRGGHRCRRELYDQHGDHGAVPVRPHGPGGSADHQHRQHHLQRSGAAAATGASPITISVGGDMEMQAGSAIRAENTVGGGTGGNITLTVGGDFTMRGPGGGIRRGDFQQPGRQHAATAGQHSDHGRQCHGQPGRRPSRAPRRPPATSCVENGAQILANALGEAGAIKMFAGKNATINGLVSSEGTLGGRARRADHHRRVL